MTQIILIAILISLTPASVWAGEQVGTLTQIQGTVKIFSHPSKTLEAKTAETDSKGPHALFEGEYFLVKDGVAGDPVEKGNIVRTSPGGKVRVVFANGDQIHVGSGTAYRVTWSQDSEKGQTEVALMYGKLRGIIEKGGPRSHLKIKTRSAVMGVRGTDFFIAEGGTDGGTEISIIRGSVEVTPTQAHQEPKKPIQVNAGFSTEITQMDAKAELRKTTQQELSGIQKSSTLTATPSVTPTPLTLETQKKIEILELKASETALKDIQTYDKKLFEQLEQKKGQAISIDAINRASITALLQEAPKAPEKHKPYKSELEDLENGAYEKYFKHID